MPAGALGLWASQGHYAPDSAVDVRREFIKVNNADGSAQWVRVVYHDGEVVRWDTITPEVSMRAMYALLDRLTAHHRSACCNDHEQQVVALLMDGHTLPQISMALAIEPEALVAVLARLAL